MSKAAELAALIGSQTAQGNRNLIINGNMAVAQRATSYADPSDGTYGSLDRFAFFNSNDGAFTASQSTTVPSGEGFYYSMKLDCTSTDSSIAAGQYATVYQNIEGTNNRILGYGASGAKSVVVSFYAKSNLTGTFCYSIRNSAVDRSFIKEFSLSAADTWERISFVIEGDTSGTWLATNGTGARHMIALSMGSTFHGTNNTWQSGNKTTTSNQVNFLSSTDNEFFVTGWQVEIGTGAPTAFEREDIGTTLQKCQRYYVKLLSNTAYDTYGPGIAYVTTQFYATLPIPTRMRGDPSIGSSGSFAAMANGSHHATDGAPAYNRALAETMSLEVYFDMTTNNLVAGHACQLRNNNDSDAYIEIISEL